MTRAFPAAIVTTMAGYSGTPLVKKLGIKEGALAAIDDIWSGLRFVYRMADRPRRS